MDNPAAQTPETKGISRRKFIAASAGASAFLIVPRHVLGGPGYLPPSEKLNIAQIGVGGRGHALCREAGSFIASRKVELELPDDAPPEAKPKYKIVRDELPGENMVAMADVDLRRAGGAFKAFPKAKKYRDFRHMLEQEEKNIDAVIVATPDHTHAVAAMAAIKMGKHVYVEKPMTHDIHEARMLTEAAKKAGVATQMGNQGHSGEGIHLICEWIWAGALGEVKEAHCWTNRPVWPQAIGRPTEKPPVPDTLDWDLWLGTAPDRPYNPAYLPFKWRGFWDFGTGVMGDMGCHIVDPIFEALKLGYPTHVDACYSRFNRGEEKNFAETAPIASIVRYKFPAREGMAPVNMTWWDGGMMPPRPAELEPGRRLGDWDGGCLFVGTKAKLMCGCYGRNPRIIPETSMREFKRPAKTLYRPKSVLRSAHMDDWIQACKGGRPAGSNFDYAGPLTETVLLANLAIRAGRPLEWDGAKMKVTNYKPANDYVRREYREGWSL